VIELHFNQFSWEILRYKDKKLNRWLKGPIEEDRSAADYGVCCKLAKLNFSEEIAAQILQAYRPYEKTARDDYLERTISKAFAETFERRQSSEQNEVQNLPEIDITGKWLRDITTEALAALYKSNVPPYIFIRNGLLVRINYDETGKPNIDLINTDSLRGILDRAANFVKITKKKNEEVATPVRPPLDVVLDALSVGNRKFPALKGISGVPIIHEDGTIIDSLGYDPVTGLFYAPAPSLEMPPIPENPTPEDIKSAVRVLKEIFCDFPFDSDASRVNAVALLITAVLRQEIEGQVPMALIDKPQSGTGATLLASVISVVATGRMGAMMPPPVDDEEMRKKITARVLAGDGLLIIDNIEGQLNSPSLATALTTGIWNDRVLGQSKTVSVEICATWIATGNNLRLGGDMPRRCYEIRLDAQQVRPWDRQDFEHPDLISWVTSVRGQILGAIYTLARAWIQAGKPKPKDSPSFGGFESWKNQVGGILGVAGVTGFLGNLSKIYEESDVDTCQWVAFLEALYEIYGESTFTTANVEKHLEDERNHSLPITDAFTHLVDALPDRLADAWSNRKNFIQVLGNALARRKDRKFPNGLKITKAGSHAHVIRWRIEREGESPNSSASVECGESGESLPAAF
jgi:hypothetical protein